MKYQQNPEIGSFLSLMMAHEIHSLLLPGSVYYPDSSSGAQLGWDTVCYIPSHSENVIKRGFYSTHYVAKALSKLLSTPFLAIQLEPGGNTTSPRSLLPKERKISNEIPEYHLRFKRVKKSEIRRVLLIDDVITTGASLEGAVRSLGVLKADKLDILSIAQSGRLHRYLFK
jgi:predicted amidophosphoribosyltransferase